MSRSIIPTNVEVFFDKDDIIVSKTDLKGRIVYANQVFCDIAGYRESEVIGQPHSMIRHPDMPRSVFKLLWDSITQGQEIFAYVKNMAKNGDHYWVFAHVTPSFDSNRQVIGYHSNRRVPQRNVLEGTIVPLYARLLAEERKHGNGKEAVAAGFHSLTEFINARKMPYEKLVFSL